MSDHSDKAVALAAKITAKAEDTLRTLEWEMTRWPAEYRAIMWSAVADIARTRQIDAALTTSQRAEK